MSTAASPADWAVDAATLPFWLNTSLAARGGQRDHGQLDHRRALDGLAESETPYEFALNVSVASDIDLGIEVPVFLRR